MLVVNVQYGERNATLAGCFNERFDACVSKAHEREPRSEQVKYRATIFQEDVRRTHTRPRARHILQQFPFGLVILAPYNRRLAITGSKLDSERRVFCITEFFDQA